MFTESENLTVPVEVMLSGLPANGLGSALSVVILITREETGVYISCTLQQQKFAIGI